jgi:glycosyltransferase involved in cell wall biosynthesis
MSTFYSTHESLRIPQIFVLQDMIYERYPALFPAAKTAAHMAEKARCAEAASVVVTPSAHALSEARHFYAVGTRPTRVIPYAVSEAFLRVPSPGNDAQIRSRHAGGSEYVLFAGGRGAHKNFAGLLAAWRCWPGHRNFRLLAVGGGPREPRDATLVEGFGLAEAVHFIPSVEEAELVNLFSAARAIVVPSISEGYGFPVIEGLAARRPVVASTGGSLPEVGGDAAIYADPRDPLSLAAALAEAVDTRDDSPRIRRGREIAESRTWARVASDYAAILKEISTP